MALYYKEILILNLRYLYLFLQGTLQQFVDRLFHTVFMKYRRSGSSLPPVVKFLFDLLDAQAKELNLTDPEVLHTWKNNRY